MVKKLKWGLADSISSIYKCFSESSKRYAPVKCSGCGKDSRTYDSREILGAWFFREFSSIDLVDPLKAEKVGYTIEEICEDSEARLHETELQIKIGKAAKNNIGWLRARTNRNNFLEIGRRCSRIIDEAYSMPENPNPSIIMADMYALRSRSERRFLDYIGRMLNGLSETNPRSYIEQMQTMHNLITKRQ